MENIEQKLLNFNNIVMRQAAEKRNKILEEARKEKERLISDKKRKFEQEAEEIYKKQIMLIKKEKNDIISKAAISAKRLLMRERDKIMSDTFAALEQKVREFVSSDSYKNFLENVLVKTIELLGEGEIEVTLSANDMNRFADLLESIQKGHDSKLTFKAATRDILGGCEALNSTNGLFIDNTLSSRIESQKENFLEICGIRID